MDSHSPTFPSRTSTEIGFDALISTLRNETLPQPPQEPVNTTNVPIEMDWHEGNECPDAVIIPNQTTLLMSAVPMSPFMMMEEEGEDPVPSFSLDTHEVQDRHRVYRKDDTELSQFPSLSKFASVSSTSFAIPSHCTDLTEAPSVFETANRPNGKYNPVAVTQ